MRAIWIVPVIASILILSVIPFDSAFAVTEDTKLIASDGEGGDLFGGGTISISADKAIVGAFLDNDKGNNSGSAYIFEKISGIWTEVAKLTASDGVADDEFGVSVSISGDNAIVGADRDDDAGTGSGSAYMFEKVSGIWTQVAKLTASDGAFGDAFGGSVSISGDKAVVGARGDDDNGIASGSAYIFQKVFGIWTEVTKLTASDGAPSDFFGQPVSISGDQAIAGSASDDNENGSLAGSAYIFEFVPNENQEAALELSNKAQEKADEGKFSQEKACKKIQQETNKLIKKGSLVPSELQKLFDDNCT